MRTTRVVILVADLLGYAYLADSHNPGADAEEARG